RAAERSVDVRKPIVVTDLVVQERPSVRLLGSGGEMLGRARDLGIDRDDRTAPARGHRLVAVEAQASAQPMMAHMPRLIARAERLGGILHDRNIPTPGDFRQAVHAHGMAEGVHGHYCPYAPAGLAVAAASARELSHVRKVPLELGGVETKR